MTTLIPRYSLKDGTSTPTGAVNRTIYDKLKDVVSVKDFGAVGDGATDDYTAITNCIAYCNSVNKTVYFPSGNYYITQGLVFSTTAGIDCDSLAGITAANDTIDTITLSPGNYAGMIIRLPQIVNGNNALLLYGTAYVNATVSNITNCVNCITLRIDNTNKTCADNIVNFTALSTSTSGILFECLVTGSFGGTLMQGNQFNGNFIVTCQYGINFYDVNAGTLGFPNWDDTEFNIFAIDANFKANSYGIYANAKLLPARGYFNIKGFFDGFTDAYISGNAINCIFKLGISATPDYAKWQLTGPGNRIICTSYGQYNWDPSTAIALVAVNNIATFNGGVPISANRFLAKITIPSGFTTNSTILGCFYHPYMTNYLPKVTAEMWSGASLRILWASESSTAGIGDPGGNTPYPFQGAIQFIGTGAVAAGDYYVWVTVHDAPQ